MICLHQGKDIRAGCFLGLALIKFQLVLPVVLVLLVKKQFRVLAGFSAVAVLLASLGGWLVGWNGMWAYPAYLWRLNQVPSASGIFPSMMPSLRGLVQGWGDMHSSWGANLITGLLSVVLLVWAGLQWNTTAPRQSKIYMAGLCIALLATQLAGYHASGYDMSMLFPVVLQAANVGAWDRELDPTTCRVLLLGALGLWFTPLYLLLIWKAQLNLMAIFLLLLLWGYSRAVKVWKAQAEPGFS